MYKALKWNEVHEAENIDLPNCLDSNTGLLGKAANLFFWGDILEAGNWKGVTFVIVVGLQLITFVNGLWWVNPEIKHITRILMKLKLSFTLKEYGNGNQLLDRLTLCSLLCDGGR